MCDIVVLGGLDGLDCYDYATVAPRVGVVDTSLDTLDTNCRNPDDRRQLV